MTRLPLSSLKDGRFGCFEPLSDGEVASLARSITEVGFIHPIVVRPLPDGTYEVLSGHQRKRAAELLGLEEVPVSVVECSDEEAELIAIDANVEGRKLTPMQLARAVRRRKEILGSRQGERTDLTSGAARQKLTREMIAESVGLSPRTAASYDRLNELVPELQSLVDSGKVSVAAGEQLSYLERSVQRELYSALGEEIAGLSRDELRRLRQEADRGYLVLEALRERISSLEAELSERKAKEGEIADLERRIEFLRKRKRDLEYDISDRETAAESLRRRLSSPQVALLSVLRSAFKPLVSAIPEIEGLASRAKPLDEPSRHELSAWLREAKKCIGVLESLLDREGEP